MVVIKLLRILCIHVDYIISGVFLLLICGRYSSTCILRRSIRPCLVLNRTIITICYTKGTTESNICVSCPYVFDQICFGIECCLELVDIFFSSSSFL
ncbi:hypothetical protein D3C72_1529070 [compost metagenome]